jgi:hypothetical protein
MLAGSNCLARRSLPTSGSPITNRGKPQKLKAQGRLQGTGCEVLDGCLDLPGPTTFNSHGPEGYIDQPSLETVADR